MSDQQSNERFCARCGQKVDHAERSTVLCEKCTADGYEICDRCGVAVVAAGYHCLPCQYDIQEEDGLA